jgi:hypothetical protein
MTSVCHDQASQLGRNRPDIQSLTRTLSGPRYMVSASMKMPSRLSKPSNQSGFLLLSAPNLVHHSRDGGRVNVKKLSNLRLSLLFGPNPGDSLLLLLWR